MKAMVYERYGPPEVLDFRDVDRPSPADDELLIRVHSVSINASDWEILHGKPLYARYGGVRRPKNRIIGSDVAGEVVEVGSAVTEFQPGDEVFGDTMYHGAGGFAEFVSVPERAPLIKKPPHLTFEEAAALPQGAVIAMAGLDSGGPLKQGAAVLINGAGGSAGTIAIQVAKSTGAAVTAVDNGLKLEFMRSLGADDVIDYTTEDYTGLGRNYDLVFDVAAHRSVFASSRVVADGGTYAMVGGSMSALLQTLTLGPVLSRFRGRTVKLLGVQPSKKALTRVVELTASGAARPIVERTYPLAELADALRHLGEGRSLGKIVVTIDG